MSRKTARNLNHRPDPTRKAICDENRKIRLGGALRLRRSAKKADGTMPAIPWTNRKTHRAWLKAK